MFYFYTFTIYKKFVDPCEASFFYICSLRYIYIYIVSIDESNILLHSSYLAASLSLSHPLPPLHGSQGFPIAPNPPTVNLYLLENIFFNILPMI